MSATMLAGTHGDHPSSIASKHLLSPSKHSCHATAPRWPQQTTQMVSMHHGHHA
jgi:hypothetical protein